MKINIDYELSKLEKMTIGELRRQYEQVFDETTNSRHKQYLIKRILWRMQANEEGGLSKRAFKRAMELANEADLRLTAPSRTPASNGKVRERSASSALRNCSQELMVGMQLERIYKGQKIIATVMENGIRWNGELYTSLSAVANAVTGSHWNGKAFFGVNGNGK